jgi:CheY-like chemotaxis protein
MSAKASSIEAAAAMTAPQTVLIIDDSEEIRRCLAEVLEAEGFAAAMAADGNAALAQLRSGLRPCAILLDLMMPVMDGRAFRQAQLSDRTLEQIPVVVITGEAVTPEWLEAQLPGVALLAKPALPEQIIDAIRRSCPLLA